MNGMLQIRALAAALGAGLLLWQRYGAAVILNQRAWFCLAGNG